MVLCFDAKQIKITDENIRAIVFWPSSTGIAFILQIFMTKDIGSGFEYWQCLEKKPASNKKRCVKRTNQRHHAARKIERFFYANDIYMMMCELSTYWYINYIVYTSWSVDVVQLPWITLKLRPICIIMMWMPSRQHTINIITRDLLFNIACACTLPCWNLSFQYFNKTLHTKVGLWYIKKV